MSNPGGGRGIGRGGRGAALLQALAAQQQNKPGNSEVKVSVLYL